MEVTVGWGTQYGRWKWSVTCDETDLARLVEQAGMDAAWAAKLTAGEAFRILQAQAYKSQYYNLLLEEEVSEAYAKEHMEHWNAELEDNLGKAKARLGL